MDLLEEVKKLVNSNIHLEDSVVRLTEEKDKLNRQASAQMKEIHELRQHVRNLVDRLNMVKAKLTGVFVDEQGRESLAAQALEHNNSVWIPDAIERTIYEGAIDQVTLAVEEVLRLLPG